VAARDARVGQDAVAAPGAAEDYGALRLREGEDGYVGAVPGGPQIPYQRGPPGDASNECASEAAWATDVSDEGIEFALAARADRALDPFGETVQ
jgi:hypothetical protein